MSRKAGSAVWSITTARPGPTAYVLGGSVGPQALSTTPTVAHVAFSKLRDTREGSNVLPSFSKGAIYSPNVSALSGCPTVPRALIGTSTREHSAIMYSVGTYTPH